jgi:hypothetical protein
MSAEKADGLSGSDIFLIAVVAIIVAGICSLIAYDYGKLIGEERTKDWIGDPYRFPKGSCSDLAARCTVKGGDSYLRNSGEFVCRRTATVKIDAASPE